MKHPLELENEDIRKRIEDVYAEIAQVSKTISTYAIFEMTENIVKNTNFNSFTNTILTNQKTYNDILKWGTK